MLTIFPDKLVEMPCPRRVSVASYRLREQPCPDWPVVEALAVLRSDFEQRGAIDDSQ
jgi:hypothetical protein